MCTKAIIVRENWQNNYLKIIFIHEKNESECSKIKKNKNLDYILHLKNE